jgi:hypothetical protein
MRQKGKIRKRKSEGDCASKRERERGEIERENGCVE